MYMGIKSGRWQGVWDLTVDLSRHVDKIYNHHGNKSLEVFVRDLSR